ncbi:MAG TPA: hypothetical protein VF591_02715 [Pyrinomonadaceae bacterium]|jgi:hypothetical protein
MRHSLITVLLLSLLLAPVRGQSGPPRTRSSVSGGGVRVKGPARVAAAAGQSSGGTFTLEGSIGQSSASAAGGTYGLQGAIGQPLAGASSGGGTFTLQGGSLAAPSVPFVQAVARASANPAIQNSSVGYTVTFSAAVTGVDTTDFQLTTAGLTGAAVTGVTGSGATYNVTVDTGTPASPGATLRLDVSDDDSVVDASTSAPLAGVGAGNGNFTSGEVYTVNPNFARANGATVSEPSAGTASLLFTVTLSAPAPSGGVSVGYATADGGAAPATGGASCGGVVDYVSAGGTLNFSSGERVKTVSVNVCADTSAGESNETLLLSLSGASGASVQVAQATGTITQGTAASTFIISELRTSGPEGSADEFVEFYNNTDTPLNVNASDASGGYGVFTTGAGCDATPVLVGTIPNGTVIPARGHYLLTGGAYSLDSYASGDKTLDSDIGDDHNVAVFTTAEVSNLSTATRLDAVGFGSNVTPSAPAAASRSGASKSSRKGVRADVLSAAGSNGVCDLLREGGTLVAVSGSAKEHTFFRKECDFVGGTGCLAGGNPKDSNNNASDFQYADTAPDVSGTQKLGAPGPENLASPIRRDNFGIGAALLDGSVASSASPNRTRTFSPGFGTLTIRRRVFNNTGADITRLRFRIIELTTFPSPAGTADLRAVTSTGDESISLVNDSTTCFASTGSAGTPCTVVVKPTTLETPPAQPNGGGFNSTFSAGTVTMEAPLANGASINLRFVLGIQQTGTFRFYIIVEALP